ncbi:ParB/RepB/Spo0J family partition protein [Nocardioides bruguierae]|uniref:ParB/RepB/Spo0J family partition protein n=1 Tax=Nocardioides bruguierae TaxID=2945102 RepID=A0A9X2DB60_9ACTN|nr:ParB/RepB/Spo0J family partition protein [Nocardioides bruguierae]MCM0622608.1 ParB/RepB/Spo0J family partition protein [Nocardioides bruguierae]
MTATTVRPLAGYALISPYDLKPSPNNPRAQLTEITALAQSIRENGLIQPIIAQRIDGDDKLQIVAGHRRHAAALRLQLDAVPVIVRKTMLPDSELLTMLVENGQRAGLDPIEEARAIAKLKATGLTDAEIGRRIGRPQNYVSNRRSLLALAVEDQEQLRNGQISIAAATNLARDASGTARPNARGKKSAQHLSSTHQLATRAQARCRRNKHKSKGAASVGGMACGECWESVIRADERQHLHHVSGQQGKCVLCGTTHDPDQPADTSGTPTA